MTRGFGQTTRSKATRQGDQEEAQDEEVTDEDVEGEEPAVILALCVKSSRILGLAAFDELKGSLVVDEIEVSSPELRETIQSIKSGIRPTLILVSNQLLGEHLSEDLHKLLTSECPTSGSTPALKILKSSCFDLDMDLILRSLRVKELLPSADDMMDTAMSKSDAYTLLSSAIPFDQVQAVRALCALVIHLSNTIFGLDDAVVVNTVQRFDHNRYLRMDSTTFEALQVLVEERHPNLIGGKGRSKEGFSIMGIFDRTRSRSGRACLREWLSRPLCNLEEIVKRQDGIELFMQLESQDVVGQCKTLLSKIPDVNRCLMHLKRCVGSFRDWLQLGTAFHVAVRITACLATLGGYHNNRREYVDIIERLLDRISVESLTRAGDALQAAIDLEITKDAKQVSIRIGYHESLDSLRSRYDQLEEFLTDEARVILDRTPRLNSLSVQYLPQLGFMVVVGTEEHAAVTAEKEFTYVFKQDDQLYYKTRRMYQLDDEVGDLAASIKDLEDKILRDLTATLIEEEVPLISAFRAISEVDVLMSLAAVALQGDFSRPQMTEERVIIIKDGRHPLQELTVESFIPNDTFLTPERSMAVLTGPNFSGKSVYLKQVGLSVYLAHCGSFIPCQSAIIGLTDSIFTRVSSLKSSTTSQSTFTIDLHQMMKIFRNASPKSLVLIDEFGKGSATIDGISLLAASITELLRMQCRSIVTTHFLEIFTQSLVPDVVVRDLSFRMDIYVPEEGEAGRTAENEEVTTVIPLFKLVKVRIGVLLILRAHSSGLYLICRRAWHDVWSSCYGVASASAGFSCAILAGVPSAVVKRAEQVSDLLQEGAAIDALLAPLTLGPSGPSSVVRFNERSQEALQTFLAVKDWRACSEETVQHFMALLRDCF